MRVSTKPRRQNSHRADATKRCAPFLQWLRGRNCFLSESGECEGKIEAAHVDHAGGKGMGTKVADRHAIPLCQKHHAMQHRIGWRSFETNYIFNASNVANTFWKMWPQRSAWERKLSDG